MSRPSFREDRNRRLDTFDRRRSSSGSCFHDQPSSSRPPIVSALPFSTPPSRSWDQDDGGSSSPPPPRVHLTPRFRTLRNATTTPNGVGATPTGSDAQSVASEIAAAFLQQQRAAAVFSNRSVVSDGGMIGAATTAAAAVATGNHHNHNENMSVQSRRSRVSALLPNRIIDVSSMGQRRMDYDDVSSLGGVEDDQIGAIQRMTLAIRNESARPSSLTREERALWDTIQAALCKAAQSGAASSSTEHENNDVSVEEQWDTKYKDLEQRVATMETDHDRSLRAIQRVLADVTAERDKALLLAGKKNTSGEENGRFNTESLNKNATADHEQQLVALVSSTNNGQPEVPALLPCDTNDKEISDLHAKLQEKSAALENAKMIITSLESASGSLAAELRGKLKQKDDVLNALRHEVSDKQKILDRLATELRDLQRNISATPQRNDEEQAQRMALATRLEKNMADIRASSVVLEATNDPAAVEQISDLLSDSIVALKTGIDIMDDVEVDSVGTDSVSVASSRSSIPFDVKRLRRDLDQRTKALRQMEQELTKKREEYSQFQWEMERLRQQKDEETAVLRQEVHSLREQCDTNMQVLMRKERELAVLRDSLKVDDGVGYISDDATDSEESEGVDGRQLASPDQHLKAGQYGPSQAEALATLLAHGQGSLEVGNANSSSCNEREVLQRELLQARAESELARKQLKTEKDSLANAKMIISSLEKANKSMMEDLRSRLQDSNTAIASLLEKSMDSEKTITTLRNQVESIQKEKEEEKKQYEEELDNMRSSSFQLSGSGERNIDPVPIETID